MSRRRPTVTSRSDFETGVGPAVSTYGGMAVMGDELSLVYHHPFAEDRNVYIIIPPTDISSAGTQEFDLLMNKARTLDYRDRELKAYLFLMDLIPALEKGDVRKAGGRDLGDRVPWDRNERRWSTTVTGFTTT